MIVALKRLGLQLTADRRKFGALCVMLTFGLLLWARLIVISNMPRTAIADEDPDVATTPGDLAADGLADKNRPPVQRVVMAKTPNRDPFVISERHFPRPTPVVELPIEAGKSAPEPTEDPEQVMARLQAMVDGLQLDAVMRSASLAVIRGETFHLGSLVPAPGSEQISFVLADVRQRSVILEYGGHEFELKMSTPGD